MTIEEKEIDSSFRSLMRDLRLDESMFHNYRTDFEAQTYDELASVKEEIERQLFLLFDILTKEYGANMSTNLVTADGFPRDDIDVVGVRSVRSRIIRLQNDMKKLYSFLLIKLQEKMAAQSNIYKDEKGSEVTTAVTATPVISSFNIPFALVHQVVPRSPAERSGLSVGDRILRIDDVHAGNHERLGKVSKKVYDSIDKFIPVDVLRNDQRHNLLLRPTYSWEGNGVLGCVFLPI